MYNRKSPKGTLVKGNPPTEGESIEVKIRRLMKNKEPLDDGVEVPLIYTERSKGVQAAYNIKTDRFDVAAGVMDKIHKDTLAKRDHKPDLKIVHKDEQKDNSPKNDVVEPTQGKADGETPQSK